MSRAEWSCGLCAVLATALTIVPAIVLAIVPAIVLAVVPATLLAIVLAHVLALVLATVLAIVLASLLAIVLASVLTIVLALVQRTRFVSVLGNRCAVKLISFQQQGPQPSLPPRQGGVTHYHLNLKYSDLSGNYHNFSLNR